MGEPATGAAQAPQTPPPTDLDDGQPTNPPAANPPEGPEPPPQPAQPQPAVVQPEPANDTGQPEESSPEPYSHGAWQRLHLVLGGGFNFDTRIQPDAEPFRSAAQDYRGGGLLIQPSFSVFTYNPAADRPNGIVDLRVGADIRHYFLSTPNDPGTPSSEVGATSLGLLGEINYFPHRHFGLGFNVNLGYVGFSSDNADIGAPYSASLDFDGGFNLGAQLFLSAWDGNIRAGAGLDGMIGGFPVDTGPGNPDLQTGSTLRWSIFGGIELLGMVRSIQGASNGGSE